MATDEAAERPYSEAVRRAAYAGTWPAGEPLPPTPVEARHAMQDWEAAPAGEMTLEQAEELPGKVRSGAGWGRLWQC